MSDAPEEQPGVLGRIGSWLWSRSSLGSSENASPRSPDPPESPAAAAEPPDSNLTDDVFYSTQSLLSADGHPSGEETPEDEWEEASSSFETHQNTKRLSHFSTGLSGKSDSDHTQEGQAWAGKKLHVYLEETSVSGSAGQEIVSTKYSKSLQVRPKAKTSVSLDAERKHSYSSALVGVNLNSQKAENYDVGGGEMGRKNARRRYRKNSQGDEKSGATQPHPDGEVTGKDKAVTQSHKAKSPKSNATSHAPETGPAPAPELKTHSSGSQCLESGQGSSGATARGGAAGDEGNMADEEYRVERKTETAESKRRSMKVSRSEVKLFPKNVPLRAEHKLVMRREQIQEETAGELKFNEAKKPDDKPKPVPGRLADKISIFENPKLGSPGQFHTPRSADVSPTRRTAERLRGEFASSRSTESLGRRRSSSSSPPRDRVMTIKERVRNFTEACNTTPPPPPPPPPSISRIHHKVSTSKSLELLDYPDQPDQTNTNTNGKAVAKVVLQLNGGSAKTNASNLKIQSFKMTEKEEFTKAGEPDDVVDGGTLSPRTGLKSRRRKNKELGSPKSETKTTEAGKLEMSSSVRDARQTDPDDGKNVAAQVSESVSQTPRDPKTTKQEAVQKIGERLARMRSAEKIPESASVEASTVFAAKEDAQNSPAKVEMSPDKPVRRDRRTKIDSSKGQDEVESSSPQLSLKDKESKTSAFAELESKSDLSSEKAGEKASSDRGKKLGETTELHDNKSKLSTNTQPREESKEDAKILLPAVKGGTSIHKQTAFEKEDNEPAASQLSDTIAQSDKSTGNKKSSIKQASPSDIGKKLTEVASVFSKEKDNLTPKSKESGQERPGDKTEGAAEAKDVGPSTEVTKSDPKVDLSKDKQEAAAAASAQGKLSGKKEGATKSTVKELADEAQNIDTKIGNKVDLTKFKLDIDTKSGPEKPRDKNKGTMKTLDKELANEDQNIDTKIGNKVDLTKFKLDTEAKSGPEKPSEKNKGTTKISDKELANEVQNIDTKLGNKVDLTKIELDIDAKSGPEKPSDKNKGATKTTDKELANKDQNIDTKIGNKVDLTKFKLDIEAKSGPEKPSDKTTKTADKVASIKEQKSDTSSENKADLVKVKEDITTTSGQEKLSGATKGPDIENKLDLASVKPEIAATSENKKQSVKKEATTTKTTATELSEEVKNKVDLPEIKPVIEAKSGEKKQSVEKEATAKTADVEPSKEVKKSVTDIENKVDLPEIKPVIEAKSGEEKKSVKKEATAKTADAEPSKEVQKIVPKIENKVTDKQDIASKSEQTVEKAVLSDKMPEINVENKLQSPEVASKTELRRDKKDTALSGEQTTKESQKANAPSSLRSEKDVARQDGNEEKIAQLSVSKGETDTPASRSQTKEPIDRDPAVSPKKEQETAGQNTAPFTAGTKEGLKISKERFASSGLPATRRMDEKGQDAGLFSTSKLRGKSEARGAVTGLIKSEVIEKGEKCVGKGDGDGTAAQKLDTETERLGQEARVTIQDEKNVVKDDKLEGQDVKKLENAAKISPSSTLSSAETVGVEDKAVSVADNDGERHKGRLTIGPTALTKPAKISGKEALPKSASETKPQAESITTENKSQRGRDDSAHKPGPVTGGVLNVAKNGKFEPKDNVEQALSGYAEKTSNLDDKKIEVKAVSESPQVLKDLTKQGSISGSKIPTSDRLSANGEVSLLSKLEPLNDASARSKKQTFKPSPEASNILNSSLKRHSLTKGRSKDEWSVPQNRDTPSSWLDLDFPRQKLKVSSEAKLTSSGSESNLLDTSADLDDADFVEKIKKLCAPFSLPPRKHNPLRNPQPPFAMPAIKEDRYEKTFDPDEFTFGLRKTNKFSFETPSLLAKLQNPEGKPSVKPARASFADRSMLLSGLESRFRDKAPSKDEKDEAKDEVKDEIKVKSRLEGSCVLNSLTTSSFRSKLSQSQAQADGTNSGNVSPSGSPQNNSPRQLVPPPPAQANPEARNKKEEIQCAGELAESDSGPPLPAFNQIKLPDFLEKYLPRETREQGQREPGKLQRARTEVDSKMPSVKEEARSSSPRESPVHTQLHTQAAVKKPTLAESTQSTPKELHAENKAPVKMPSPAGPAEEPSVTNALKLPPSLTNHFSGISLTDQAPPRHAPPKRRPSSKIRPAKGSHTRPGKMLLFEKAPFEGQVYEVHRDVEDATFMQFSPLVSVRVVRGCWVLYEKPGFQGRTIALEEGGLELANVWAQPEPGPGLDPGLDPDLDPQVPMQIGSIRLAVSDYALPHIDLFTEPEGRGRVTPYHDDIVETGSFGIPLSTSSIQVHSGVWLVFSDPGFQGMLAVLETGVYPFPETWGFPSPFVGSLRPLKMGGFKVENPNEVKAVVFEKAAFEGPSVETETDVFCFGEEDGGQDAALQCVGSLKILGGLWVGYSEPGFEGQQYILEEGEYLRCEDWGGAEILSLRPIMSDFMSPHLKMFSDADFGALGVNIDLTVPVINLDETGYGLKTQSMDVLSGVWVVFEEPGFSGESFLLEKGQYGNPEDWGSKRPTVASAMPVVLENFETTAKFKVQLFPEADFRGSALVLEDSEGCLPPGFSVGSCKVLAGSWLAFEGQEFSGRMYVLDEGSYPDLRAMGCVHASATILSLQVVGFEFSLPSIVLFERCGLKGKRLVLSDGEVNLLMSGGGGRVQSVLVEGGMWVLYEEINYRGAQMLLRPGEVSDWRSFSGWKKVGSLRPLLQKQVHFHIRSRQSGHLMTVTGDLDDIKLLRVQEMEESQGFEQIWFFQSGHLRCKLLEECCLCPSSSVTIAGARVGLAPALDDTAHLWNIAPDGVIAYSASPNLVLEVKGGHNYDKTQVVLNTRDPKRLQQQWVIEVL